MTTGKGPAAPADEPKEKPQPQINYRRPEGMAEDEPLAEPIQALCGVMPLIGFIIFVANVRRNEPKATAAIRAAAIGTGVWMAFRIVAGLLQSVYPGPF